MSLFKNLSSEGLEQTEDRIGGNFGVVESNIYEATIKVAYAGKSANSNSQNVTFVFDLGNREYTETFWITNRNGENFFRNKQDDKKKIPLPGFTMVDDICQMTTGKPLSEQETEEKQVLIYDYEAKKQLPKAAEVLTDLTNQKVSLAISKILENKNAKADDGTYKPTAETREINATDKVFHHPTNLTMVEARNEITEPGYYNAWLEKNKGKVRDNRKIKDGDGAPKSGRPGGPPQAAASGAPKTSSLFAQK